MSTQASGFIQSHQQNMYRLSTCKQTESYQTHQNIINQSNPQLMQYKVQECQLLQQINQLQQVQIRQFRHSQSQQQCIPLQECVAGFWDYENIPFKTSNFISLTDFYKSVQSKTDQFIGRNVMNKRMTLYGKFKDISTNICEDACDLGMDTVNVESKRKEESVDKRIIADIGLFAATCAEQGIIGHIVLISGDRDYGYILSQVRCRKHIGNIILFHNENTKPTLLHHAHATFCILKRKRKPSNEPKKNKKKKQKKTVNRNNENYNLVWRKKRDSNNDNRKVIQTRSGGITENMNIMQVNWRYCSGTCARFCGIIVMILMTLMIQISISFIARNIYQFELNDHENYMDTFYWNDTIYEKECELGHYQYNDVFLPLNMSNMICRDAGLSVMFVDQTSFM